MNRIELNIGDNFSYTCEVVGTHEQVAQELCGVVREFGWIAFGSGNIKLAGKKSETIPISGAMQTILEQTTQI